ncbi:RecX family transcriptional regulator [Candidatus Saccharibacteria bacterium]|nr:RecX family transcriptional regulator [Candidatus Saccharibacteria bacterium]
MKITDISLQAKNPDRVNVSVDGNYRFSLDVSQVSELGVKLGKEYTDEELQELETESQFGKLYARALEYCMLRPHSVREVRDYLYRKTLTKKYRDRQGEVKERQGYSPALTSRVLDKLQQKQYVSDENFARWWIENRNLTKGTSLRKLTAELRAKGVAGSIIEEVLGESERTDEDELAKIIAKKRGKYADDQKLMSYLARQGFGYDDIKSALKDFG